MAGFRAFFVLATIVACRGGDSNRHAYVTREQYEELKTKLSSLQDELSQVLERLEEAETEIVFTNTQSSIGASLYTRWGRTQCPSGAERVYAGQMSSARNTDTGSGSTFLCLPFAPQYANYTEGVQTSRGEIYGTEYQGDPDLIFDPSNRGGPSFVDQDVPCVVCEITTRSSVIMIPAKNTCPQNWTVEYVGYLTSASKNSGGSRSYECIDYQPETLFGGAESDLAAFIYNVEGRCGALSCPNYVDGYELTCVVCSK